MCFAAPQGSVLGPLFFTTYCLGLSSVFKRHQLCYHMYADDIQLHVEFTRDQQVRVTTGVDGTPQPTSQREQNRSHRDFCCELPEMCSAFRERRHRRMWLHRHRHRNAASVILVLCLTMPCRWLGISAALRPDYTIYLHYCM